MPSPGNPQALNRYSYGYNNPVKYIDPTGHFVLLVGGMSTGNDEEANLDAWKVIMEQLHLDPTHQTGEEWAFYNWGNEPGASSVLPMEIAAGRLDEQIAGKTDIKLVDQSRGGALVMEYGAQVAEGKLSLNSELKGMYSIDGALSPQNSLLNNPIADERFGGGIGPFSRSDRYADLHSRLETKGLSVDVATFDNKADWPFTTHDSVPGADPYEWNIEAPGWESKRPWERWNDAHGILQSFPLVGSTIHGRAYRH